MRFSSYALTAAVAIGSHLAVFGFTPNTSFTRAVVKSSITTRAPLGDVSHRHGCNCSSCLSTHPASCRCLFCGISALRMSTEAAEAVSEEVPPEVAAMDGIASDDEAHNADRPSRGSLHKKTKKESKGTPLSELEIGSMVKGKVKAIMSYGAFLDIGASTDALLHISRLSDDFVSDVKDVITEGESVEVRIVSVDEEKGQVAVSLRSEEADAKDAERRSGGGRQNRGRPAKDTAAVTALAESGYDSDKFVEGEVVSTLDFGAFVRVDISQLADDAEGQIEGLVHISSLTAGRVDSVDSICSTGDKVQVRVKMVDPKGGKVSLSMIPASEETQPAARREGGGRPKKQRWAPSEMGAEDWADSLAKFQETQPAFKNDFIIVDKRKK